MKETDLIWSQFLSVTQARDWGNKSRKKKVAKLSVAFSEGKDVKDEWHGRNCQITSAGAAGNLLANLVRTQYSPVPCWSPEEKADWVLNQGGRWVRA